MGRELATDIQATPTAGPRLGRLPRADGHASGRLQVTWTHATCRLEPPTELVVLARVEAKTIVELRALSVDCDVDAAWHAADLVDGVNAEQSVAWLASVVSTCMLGRRGTAG